MGSQSGLSLGLLIGAVVIPRVRRRVIILGMERQLAARSVVENLSRGVVVDELWARGGRRCVLGDVESWWRRFGHWIVRWPSVGCGLNGGRRCGGDIWKLDWRWWCGVM